MKQLFFIFLMFVFANYQAQNQTKDVLTLMQEQEVAWNNGNVYAFMQHYWKNDSLKFIGSKGVTYGWQKTLQNYLKSYPAKEDMGVLKFIIIEATQLSEESIYVIGRWELKKEKPVAGHFTLLWKKIENRWVIVADHTS